MTKRIVTDDINSFGQRIADLRKEAGLSQKDLAEEIGVSQRVIAYYEKETNFPPTHLLPRLAKALNVSADELLGLERIQKDKTAKNTPLWKRFCLVEKLNSSDKRQLLKIIDTFIENDRLKKEVS